jgi:hypothetical protein
MTLRLTNVGIVSYIYYSSVHTGRALGFVHRNYDVARGGSAAFYRTSGGTSSGGRRPTANDRPARGIHRGPGIAVQH